MKDQDFKTFNRFSCVEPTHKEFVDLMYLYFGLEEHPGYPSFVFRPLLISESTAVKINTVFLSPIEKIYDHFGDYEKYIDFLFDITHGTAHCLHYKANPSLFKKEFHEKNYRLIEMVADLSSLMFFQKTRNETEFKRVQDYYLRLSIGYRLSYELCPHAILENKLLQKLTKVDVEGAKPIISDIIGEKHLEELVPFDHS